ncbi:MAG: hypothetical protein LBH00_09210 [Planctomycetaceae bacterium]|jgi:RNA ligase (TIGR02306 family)|nr:hypothetical protein [Planctomycetaceae bacterium]
MSEERKLASVVTIKNITPIEGADRIVLASMEENSWRCIVGAGTYTPGDQAVYFEIDSILPQIPYFQENKYLVERKFRIKTLKMRGVISQGYIVPMQDTGRIFRECGQESWGMLHSGSDVTALMKVTKWEEPEASVNMNRPKDAKPFPNFIQKTDQIRIQSIEKELFLHKILGKKFLITVKVDGTSASVFWNARTKEYGCCSRNLQVYSGMDKAQNWLSKLRQWFAGHFFKQNPAEPSVSELTIYSTVPKQYGLDEKLPQFCRERNRSLALQGEIIGEGIQSNREKVKGKEFLIFDIWDIDHQQYLPPEEVQDICGVLGLKYVPVVQEEYIVGENIDELVALADGPGYNNDCREGIVAKRRDDPNVSFKVISNQYLLKHGL